MDIVKEVCVESFDEAIKAVERGATRIELCENLSVGGTTPSYGTIRKCLEKLSVPVMVMIRPRGGNFTYSQDEFEIMQEDILLCKKLSVPGVVFGLLDEQGMLDEVKIRLLVQLSRPMQVTFHKAIDSAANIMESVVRLKDIGVERILSSGGKPTAIEGQETLNRMIEIASPQLSIIVAGKVDHENLEEIRKIIPASEYHGRRLVQF
ncbi:MAG: copper homeostasis protein CutC [Prolixibacteraceae bacterium]|nr:copper homeostasis protein CutC [Prolixibacteraceae bacterium]